MKCSKCSRELPEGIKYCIYCSADLFKECPSCARNIEVAKGVCDGCGLNLREYEHAKELLEEGKKLEREWKYSEAKAKYEEINTELVPIYRDEVGKLLSGVIQKLKIISECRFSIESKRKRGGARRALLPLIKLQELVPDDKDVSAKLESIQAMLRRRARKIWAGIGVVIILVLTCLFYWRTHTLYALALKGLQGLLGSSDLDVKNSSALVLGWYGDRTGLPILEFLANSGDIHKRVYSLSVLLSLGDARASELLKSLLYENNIPARIAAAWLLVDAGDTTIVPELVAYLNSADQLLSVSSAVLLFNLGYSVGLKVIESALKSDIKEFRFRALYALYLLGERKVLQGHEEMWAPFAKSLLWDSEADVSVVAAFLLNEFSRSLTHQDSLAIERRLWEEFAGKVDGLGMLRVEEIPEINGFYITKGIINHIGDEDIVKFGGVIRKIREKCLHTLSRVELRDESVMDELKEGLYSNDKYERLYSAIVMFKCDNKAVSTAGEAESILKELMRAEDEVLRLTACKLVLEFVER